MYAKPIVSPTSAVADGNTLQELPMSWTARGHPELRWEGEGAGELEV